MQSADPSLAVFASALNEFGKHVGAGALEFNESGVCRLVVDDLFQIDIEHDTQRDCLHLYWIAKPGNPLSMMEANYAMHRESGACFLYDPDAEEYVLHDVVSLATAESGGMDDCLQNFAKLILYWREKLADSDKEHVPESSPSGLSV